MSFKSFHKGAGAEGGGGRLFVNSASVGAKNKSEQQISRKPKLVQDKVSIQVEIAVRQCGKRFELSKKYPTTFFVHLFFSFRAHSFQFYTFLRSADRRRRRSGRVGQWGTGSGGGDRGAGVGVSRENGTIETGEYIFICAFFTSLSRLAAASLLRMQSPRRRSPGGPRFRRG